MTTPNTTPEPRPEPATVESPRAPPVPDPDRRVGTALGKYHLLRFLGAGGMGVVYEAEDTILRRRVALKLLSESAVADPHIAALFLREGRAAARLNHPHVVTVHEADQHNGTYYLVLELVTGGSLQDVLRERGPLSWREATQVVADACCGLAAAHAAGLIHRDLKPSNLLRTAEGVVKLADFGLARVQRTSTSGTTEQGGLVGTPEYMSPEQCQEEPLDVRTDIYSLGATYFALLTGRPPFSGDSAVEIMFAHCSKPVPDPRTDLPDLPPGCAGVVQRAMAKYPAQRYGSADEMLAALRALLTTDQEPSSGARVPPRPDRPRARRLLAVGGLLTVVLAALLTWRFWPTAPGSPPGRDTGAPDDGREQAIAAVQKLKGTATFDNDASGPVTGLDLTSEVTSADLVHLGSIPRLRRLVLRCPKVDDAGLVHLEGLKELEWLELHCPLVGNDGLRRLAGLGNLKSLLVPGTRVSDEGLKHLAGLKNLGWLNVRDTGICGPGLAHLKGAPIVRLEMDGTKVTNADLTHLRNLPHLLRLNLSGTKVAAGGLVNLAGLTRLDWLDLAGTRVTGADLVHLKNLKRLRILFLGGTLVDDDGLANLRDLTKLELLSLWGTKVSDKGLGHLKGLIALTDLDWSGTRVTRGRFQELQNDLPLLKTKK
jgi:serine/threonine protein kinase